jgi:hypothetical protein
MYPDGYIPAHSADPALVRGAPNRPAPRLSAEPAEILPVLEALQALEQRHGTGLAELRQFGMSTKWPLRKSASPCSCAKRV